MNQLKRGMEKDPSWLYARLSDRADASKEVFPPYRVAVEKEHTESPQLYGVVTYRAQRRF
jgi:hypothetical protein